MRDFSIEAASENIYDPRVREYFSEILKSYYSENYRSAVVVLYTVVICDLVFKLQFLKEQYEDEPSSVILAAIEESQKTNPASADWENKLIQMIREKTNLLDMSDQVNITSLQKHRHLCAHPIITRDFELFNPSREIVRAHIRSMLEGILTKPPLFSRKIFDDFVRDLASVKDTILDDIRLSRYLNTKYYERFSPIVERQILVSLWKLVFKIDNEDCEENRDINYQALSILIERNKAGLLEVIRKDKEKISEIDIKFINEIIDIVNEYPEIYNYFTEHTKILIDTTITENKVLRAAAVFKSENIVDHLLMVIEEELQPNTDIAVGLCTHGILEGWEEEALDFNIKLFGQSRAYDTADIRFSELIQPYLGRFTKRQLELLIRLIDANSQIYDRRRAKFTNQMIYNHAKGILPRSFDFSEYPNFLHLGEAEE